MSIHTAKAKVIINSYIGIDKTYITIISFTSLSKTACCHITIRTI